jgi:hypothetical protein
LHNVFNETILFFRVVKSSEDCDGIDDGRTDDDDDSLNFEDVTALSLMSLLLLGGE